MKRMFVATLAAFAALPAVAGAATLMKPTSPLVQRAVAEAVSQQWRKRNYAAHSQAVRRLALVEFECTPAGGAYLTCDGVGPGGVTVVEERVQVHELTATFTSHITGSDVGAYLSVRLS
jgi:hypothetical protein